MRVVDADFIIQKLTDFGAEKAELDRDLYLLGGVIAIVDNAPTIETVKHGKWLYKGMDGDWQWHTDGKGQYWHNFECSICHKKQTNENYAYCPNCGAIMTGTKP